MPLARAMVSGLAAALAGLPALAERLKWTESTTRFGRMATLRCYIYKWFQIWSDQCGRQPPLPVWSCIRDTFKTPPDQSGKAFIKFFDQFTEADLPLRPFYGLKNKSTVVEHLSLLRTSEKNGTRSGTHKRKRGTSSATKEILVADEDQDHLPAYQDNDEKTAKRQRIASPGARSTAAIARQ